MKYYTQSIIFAIPIPTTTHKNNNLTKNTKNTISTKTTKMQNISELIIHYQYHLF